MSVNVNRLDLFLQKASARRSLIFSVLLLGALISFEIFNYSTTDFALTDLLGNLKFGGLRWATILALAFTGIDFAGIARLLTPEQGAEEPAEVWYLFGAWLLAATMNALLTWWGVSIAILSHQSLGNAVIGREALLTGVPIFVALMVWLSRVLIIGTFSIAGERIFSYYPKNFSDQKPVWNSNQFSKTAARKNRINPSPRSSYAPSFKPAPKSRVENTYQQAPLSAKSREGDENRAYL